MALSFLLVLAFGGVALSAQAAPNQEPVDSAAYLLVIDHSGSMRDKDGGSRSRWDRMVERATEFLRNQAPPESLIWVSVFDAPASKSKIMEKHIGTVEDRESLIQFIGGVGAPTNGGTALYDSLWDAFERAELLSKEIPGRYISVMVYSDGNDRDSKRKKAEISARFGRLIDQNTSVWCFFTPLVEDLDPPLPLGPNVRIGSPKVPVPVQFRPSAIRKTTPASGKCSFELELFVPDAADSLFPRGAKVDWQGNFGADLVPSTLPLVPGPVRFTLTAKDPSSLDPAKDFEGSLRFTWPDHPDHVLQGPDSLPVRFQAVEPPRIHSVFPESGAVVAVGEEVQFLVETLQGAEVTWDFLGDGTFIRRGSRAAHTFRGVGTYPVEVSVRDPDSGLVSSRVLRMEAIDVGVGIDPLRGPVWAGVPYTFSCTGRGGVEGYQWIVDGKSFLGMGDGGRQLVYTFEEAGTVTILVRANHTRTSVKSEPVEVEVGARPSLGIFDPQDGARIVAGQPTRLVAEVSGPVESVTWILTDVETGAVVREAEVPVARGSGVSTLEHTFVEDGPSEIQVSANAALGIPGLEDLSAGIELAVDPPARSLAMVRPKSGEVLEAGDLATFELSLTGPGYSAVEWSASWGEGGPPAVTGRSEPTPDGIANWSTPLETDRGGEITVRAETLLDSGMAGPSLERTWKVAFPEVVARLSVSGGDGFDDPVRFVVEGEDLREVHWDFGNGVQERTSALENSHVYGVHGRFSARIEVVGAGGKRRQFAHHVDIPLRSPKAVARLAVEGEDAAAFAPDEIIELVDASEGDVVSSLWTLDGVPLDPGKRNLLFDDSQRGDHVLTLTVTGPPGANGVAALEDTAELRFRVVRFDHAFFVIGAALSLSVLGVLARFLLGNGPKRWRFHASCPYVEDLGSDGFPALRLARYWSRWAKRARLPVDKLHLGNEPAKDRNLVISPRATGRRSERPFAAVTYSHLDRSGLTSGQEIRHQSPSEMVWRIWDEDLEGLEGDSLSWGFHLTKPKTAGRHLPGDILLLILSSLIVLAVVYYLYDLVYLSF